MVVVFLAVQLCTSVFSRIDYGSQHAHTGGGALPSDSEQIAMARSVPLALGWADRRDLSRHTSLG